MLWLVLACVPPSAPAPEAPVAEEGRSVDSLWVRPPAVGARVALRGALLVSGRATDGGTVHAQDAVTGAGVALRPAAPLDGWPPPVGTVVDLSAIYGGPAGAPVLWLDDPASVVVTGTATPLVAIDPVWPPAFTLARFGAVTVTSEADPTGRTSTGAGFALDGRLGFVPPPPGSVGSVTGIVLVGRVVAPRGPADWEGEFAAPVTVHTTPAAIAAGAHADGTWVSVEGVVASPWTRDGRAVVLQDEGEGLWVDAEGFGPWPIGPGARVRWEGELRVTRGAWRLRTWVPPARTGEGEVVLQEGVAHGALIERSFEALSDPDVLGERTAVDGAVLDDRFRPLDTLPAAVTLRVVVDLSEPTPRYAALP